MTDYAPPAFEAKICPPDQLANRAAALARPLVFTNGCFDILHRGHVTYLAQARALGAAMVVADRFDWIAMQTQPLHRAGALGVVLLVCGVVYFGALLAMGFRPRDFRRIVN